MKTLKNKNLGIYTRSIKDLVIRLMKQIEGNRRVFDRPAPRLEVTKHQVGVNICCDGPHAGAFPGVVSKPVQFGGRIRTLSVLLSTGCKTRRHNDLSTGEHGQVMHSRYAAVERSDIGRKKFYPESSRRIWGSTLMKTLKEWGGRLHDIRSLDAQFVCFQHIGSKKRRLPDWVYFRKSAPKACGQGFRATIFVFHFKQNIAFVPGNNRANKQKPFHHEAQRHNHFPERSPGAIG
jgi:hypothetical protein